jgi:EF-hand domain pair
MGGSISFPEEPPTRRFDVTVRISFYMNGHRDNRKSARKAVVCTTGEGEDLLLWLFKPSAFAPGKRLKAMLRVPLADFSPMFFTGGSQVLDPRFKCAAAFHRKQRSMFDRGGSRTGMVSELQLGFSSEKERDEIMWAGVAKDNASLAQGQVMAALFGAAAPTDPQAFFAGHAVAAPTSASGAPPPTATHTATDTNHQPLPDMTGLVMFGQGGAMAAQAPSGVAPQLQELKEDLELGDHKYNPLAEVLTDPENQQMLYEMFNKYDQDRTGGLSADEVYELTKDFLKLLDSGHPPPTITLAQKIIDTLDTDGNGTVSFKELCENATELKRLFKESQRE